MTTFHRAPILPRTLAAWLLAAASIATSTHPAIAAPAQGRTPSSAPDWGADGCRTIGPGIQRCSASIDRTRAGVIAELRNAQAAGALRGTGELSEAPVGAPVGEGTALAVTRGQVKTALAAARSRHEPLHFSEL